MNLKKIVLMIVIVAVGIIAIELFIFPKVAEDCDCLMGFEVQKIFCEDQCIDSECLYGTPSKGYCYDGKCQSYLVIYCIPGMMRGRYDWEEPCFSCSPW